MGIRELQQRMKKTLQKRRVEYPNSVVGMWKDVMRERIAATWNLVDFKAFRGDCHSHTNHSDGVGTVAENVHFKEQSGLDFLFITDHWGITQKRECTRYENVWWGQEPATQYHHLGILGNVRRYEVQNDLVKDYNEVLALGAVPFIPHPTGWFPRTRYNDEQKDALELLGPRFNMEIINGANQVYDCFDVTDAMSIELWDKYLCQGFQINAMGNTDAHLPYGIGDVWNGVFADELSMDAVMDGVDKGHLFVSDGPVVNFTCKSDGAIMGDTIIYKPGANIVFEMVCADSAGLSSVRVIKDGKVESEIAHFEGELFTDTMQISYEGGSSYYRLECRSADGRRGYSNPIYVTEA